MSIGGDMKPSKPKVGRAQKNYKNNKNLFFLIKTEATIYATILTYFILQYLFLRLFLNDKQFASIYTFDDYKITLEIAIPVVVIVLYLALQYSAIKYGITKRSPLIVRISALISAITSGIEAIELSKIALKLFNNQALCYEKVTQYIQGINKTLSHDLSSSFVSFIVMATNICIIVLIAGLIALLLISLGSFYYSIKCVHDSMILKPNATSPRENVLIDNMKPENLDDIQDIYTRSRTRDERKTILYQVTRQFVNTQQSNDIRVLFEMNKPVAFSILQKNSNKLTHIFVDPMYRNSGYGKFLLLDAELYAKKEGYDKIDFIVENEDYDKARFLKKNGWTQKPFSENNKFVFEIKLR